ARVVEPLAGGKRPPVPITINGHSWQSRIAIMRGRHLIGFSKANRAAAGVDTGAEVEVEVELDTEPRVVAEPEELTRALDGAPAPSPPTGAPAPSGIGSRRASDAATSTRSRARRNPTRGRGGSRSCSTS